MENAKKEMLAQQLIESVNENGDLCKALVSAEDASSVQKVLAANGFEVTVEEVEAIFEDGVNEIMNTNGSEDNGELSEDQLENISGGGFLRGALRTTASAALGFGYGVFCGICPAASAGAPYVAGGLATWSAVGFKKKGW